MKNCIRTALALLCFLMAGYSSAQDQPEFEVTQLADHIYKLSIDGGGYTVKVIASVGEDGLLIVDAGQAETIEALKKSLLSLKDSIPDIIVSTHSHIEHTAGNQYFEETPIKIGHVNLRTRLRSGSFLYDEFSDASLPNVTFADSISIYFNGEEIKLIAFPGSHDNSDIIVWFTKSKIVCVGALSNGAHFPSVDNTTGDVLKYPEIVRQVIDRLPDDVTIIPGHGEDGNMDDYRKFYKMLLETFEVVRAEFDNGKDLAAVQEEDILKDWESFECSYVDRNKWVEYIMEGLQGKDTRPTIFEPMYYALKDKGIDGAIKYYYELKKNHAGEYQFAEAIPFFIGYKLYGNNRYQEAIAFCDLYLKECPEGDYAWMAYHFMGRGYKDLGEKEPAIENFKKSLEINPENTKGAELLQELEGK